MISSIVSRLVILVFGTLYPAYASYKAVRTKNVKEYVKWMMYWIVFALFTCAETFTDVFLSFWFPFYYEIKIILVLWLLSPATKGSSILYRKFVHPMLSRREQEIDEYIAKAKEQGYTTVLHLGTKGVNYATSVIMQTAIKGGGGLVQQLRRSYSLSDLSTDTDIGDVNRNNKSKMLTNIPDEDLEETDDVSMDGHRLRRPRGYSPRRSASGSGRMEMYFPEVDVDVRQHGSHSHDPSLTLSAEPLYSGHHPTRSEGLATSREPLVRTASVGGASRTARTRAAAARGGAVPKRASPAEDSEQWDGDEAASPNQEQIFYYGTPPSSLPVTSIPLQSSLSQTEVLLLLQQLNAAGIPASVSATNIETVETSAKSDESKLPHSSTFSKDIEGNESRLGSEILTEQEKSSAGNSLIASESSIETFSGAPKITEENSNITLENVRKIGENEITEQKIDNDKERESSIAEEDIHKNKEVKEDSPEVFSDSISAEENLSTESQEKNSDECPIEISDLNKTLTEGSTKLQELKETAVESNSNEIITVNNEKLLVTEPYSSEQPQLDVGNSTKTVIEDELLSVTETDITSLSTDTDVSVSVPVDKNEVKEVKSNKLEDILIPTPVEDLSNTIESNVEKLLENLKVLQSSSLRESSLSINSGSKSNISKTEHNSACPTPTLDKCIAINSSENVIDVQNSTSESPVLATSSQTIEMKENEVSKIVTEVANSSENLAVDSVSVKSSDDQDEKKDMRSGRYHKLHAPSPPKKLSEQEISENISGCLTPAASKSEIVQSSADSDSVDDASAVTARLVLQPGVVKTFSTVSSETSSIASNQKFVSNPPKSKKKKKQRGSAITRLFTLPSRNQLGHFASYLPFWHSPKEGSQTAPSSVSSEERDKSHLSFEARAAASGSSATLPSSSPKPNLLTTAPMSTCSLEYLPYVGTTDDLALAAAMNREKSNSISNFRVRDLSHSPPLSRRQ